MLYEASSCFLGTPLGSWASKGEPLAGPKCDPAKRSLVFKHGYPTAGGCQIPDFEGERLHFNPSEVLGISLCPTRHMEEGEATFIGQNILRDILQGAFPIPEYPNFDFPWLYLISSAVRRFSWNERKAELNDYWSLAANVGTRPVSGRKNIINNYRKKMAKVRNVFWTPPKIVQKRCQTQQVK